MSEMIERVARAIYAVSEADIDWTEETYQAKNIVREEARAAIEAMRLPTTSMIISATRFENRLGEGRVEVNYGVVAMDIWPKMIDAALNPPTPKAGP